MTSKVESTNSSKESRSQLDEFREELGEYIAEMRSWSPSQGSEVMGYLASMNARAAQMRHWLHSQQNRSAHMFRQNELQDFLDTCDFQFRVYSRIQSVKQSEITMSRGF